MSQSSPSECIVVLSIETAVRERWPSLTTQHGHSHSVEGVQVILVRDARIDGTLMMEFDQYKMVTGSEVVDRIAEVIDAWWAGHNLPSVASETTP